MSYLVLVVILFIILSMISLFNTVSERMLSAKQRFYEQEKQKRYEQAFHMRGQLHRMKPDAFQKWVADLYEEQGYRTKFLTHGEERTLLIEKEGNYKLVGPSNYVWPVSQLVLERLYSRRGLLGVDHLIVISTSGFNLNAGEWVKERPGIELISEEGLFALCQEGVMPIKGKTFQPLSPSVGLSRNTNH